MPTGPRPFPGPLIVRVDVSGTQGGLPFAMVFWCQTDSPGITTNAGAKDFADAFRAKLAAANIFANLSNTVSVTQIRAVVQLDADTAVVGVNTTAIPGAAAGAVLPSNAAIVLSWTSSAYWRGGKPRNYLPGVLTVSADTNHSLRDADKATFKTAAETLRTGVNAITTPAVDSTTMGFVSFVTGGQWRAVPQFFAYDGVLIHDRLGSQRRRLGPWLP